MYFLLLLFVLPLVIAAVAAYNIGRIVHSKLVKTGNQYAKLIGIITFIGSFVLILVATYVLIACNIHWER